MNNRGYATFGVLMIILILTSMYLGLFYGGILNTNKDVAKSSLISNEMVKESNGKERLYSLLKDNISFVGQVTYEDLDRGYEIKTLDETYESVSIHSDSYSSESFLINNKTDINVHFVVMPIDIEESYSYSAELILNGKDMFNDSVQNVSSGINVTIDKDEIYNTDTQETNYGYYSLNFTDLNNCTVSAVITYDKLINRELSIIGRILNKNVVIYNEESGTEIKFKEGG